MSIEVILKFSTIAEAAHALTHLAAGQPAVAAFIGHDDRPDVGRPDPLPAVPQAPLALTALPDPAALAFAGAVVSGPLAPATPGIAVAPTAPLAPTLPSAGTSPVVAPSAPTAAAPSAIDRDSQGMPWDARIHASTKTKTDAGAWVKKRNVPDNVRTAVEAELRGQPAPAPAAQPPGPPPVTAPAPAQTAAAAPADFGALMVSMAPYFTAQAERATVLSAQVLQSQGTGLTAIGQLAGRADLIPAFWQQFAAQFGPL